MLPLTGVKMGSLELSGDTKKKHSPKIYFLCKTLAQFYIFDQSISF